MKTIRFILPLCGLLLAAATLHAQGFAPATNIGNTLFTGVITGNTGAANNDGTISDLFTTNGIDYSVSTTNALSSPASYSYANTGANTGTLTEGSLTVALTFASSASGTFAANYGGGATQTGTFNLTSVGLSSPLVNSSSLVNLSAGQSSTLGFVVAGGVPRTVLVRAVGPTLASFGVGGTLATPSVTLWNSAGTSIGTNTGWGGTAAIQAAFLQAGAFGLSASSKDSALVMVLNPGTYTVRVSSSSATDSGLVLVEVYIVN